MTTKTRVREPMESNGIIFGARKAGMKYSIDATMISRWIKSGDVKLANPVAKGEPLAIDEASLRARIALYTPHTDNLNPRRKRAKSNTIPEARLTASRTYTRPSSIVQEILQMETADWVAKFYEYKTMVGGEIKKETMKTYRYTFRLFGERFPVLPMEPYIESRKLIIDWIHGLQGERVAGAISASTKAQIHRNLSTFYHWMNREHGHQVPNLTQPNIARVRTQNIPIWPDETHALLGQCLNHSQKTIVMLLAQTGMRIGELCSIRPEMVHDHKSLGSVGGSAWVEVWGKPTKANPDGYRTVPIPDEAFEDLRREFQTYGELVWVGERGQITKLVPEVEVAIEGRKIDLRVPSTYRVNTRAKSTSLIQSGLRRMLKAANVYEKGKGAHSFRRAYQAEYLKNGGKKEYMRLIMGHFSISDMDDLYTHAKIEDVAEQANRFAPRRFMTAEAETADLKLLAASGVLEEDEESDDGE